MSPVHPTRNVTDRAKHVDRMSGSVPTQGRIRPARVTPAYLRRLTDEVCDRYHRSMRTVSDTLVDRYVQTRMLLEDEIERYRQQGDAEQDDD